MTGETGDVILTRKLRAKIVELSYFGLSPESIASDLLIPQATVELVVNSSDPDDPAVRRAKVKRLALEGASVEEVAKALGALEGTVLRDLEAAGLHSAGTDSESNPNTPPDSASPAPPLPPASRSPITDRRAKIEALVREGKLLAEIVEATGERDATVRNDLKALGIDISEVSEKALLRRTIGELARGGNSLGEMIAATGLSESAVRHHLNRLGIHISEVTGRRRRIEPPQAPSYNPALSLLLATGDSVDAVSADLKLTREEAERLKADADALLRSLPQDASLLAPYLRDLAAAGMDAAEVEARTGAPAEAVRAVAKKSGVALMAVSPERAARIRAAVKDFHARVPATETARRFGVSKEMIRQDLALAGLSARGRRAAGREGRASTSTDER